MKVYKLIVGVGFLAAAASASAFKIPGVGDSAPAAGGSSLSQQQGILKSYVDASGNISAAQAEMIDALGFKDQAAALLAQGQALSGENTTKDQIEKFTASSEGATKLADDALAKGATLSDEAKQHFAHSLIPFSKGLAQSGLLVAALKPFGEAAKTDISNAPLLQKPTVTSSLAPGMYLVKEFPGYSSNVLDSFKKYVKFAQTNQIPIPKEATDLL